MHRKYINPGVGRATWSDTNLNWININHKFIISLHQEHFRNEEFKLLVVFCGYPLVALSKLHFIVSANINEFVGDLWPSKIHFRSRFCGLCAMFHFVSFHFVSFYIRIALMASFGISIGHTFLIERSKIDGFAQSPIQKYSQYDYFNFRLVHTHRSNQLIQIIVIHEIR